MENFDIQFHFGILNKMWAKIRIVVGYLVKNSTTNHIKWTLTGFVKIKCDLCINAHTKIIAHMQFTVWQPIHINTSHRLTLNIDKPTIQLNGFSISNLEIGRKVKFD